MVYGKVPHELLNSGPFVEGAAQGIGAEWGAEASKL